MKKRLSIILLAGLPFALIAGENLIKNGDFEQGSSEWDGDANIVFETGDKTNGVCKIGVGSEEIKFSQRINTENIGLLTVRFKIKKSSDYRNASVELPDLGYYIRFYDEAGKSIMGKGRSLPSGNDWQTIEFESLDIVNAGSHITIAFSVFKGVSGSLFFDDIEVIAEARTDKPPAVFTDQYRTFTDKNGREIEAKIISMASDGRKVTVQRKGQRNSTTVPVMGFNDETQAYIKCWSQYADFLNERLFSIDVQRKSEEAANRSVYREVRTTRGTSDSFTIDVYDAHWIVLEFKNRSRQSFSNVFVQYCINYFQESDSGTKRYGRLYSAQHTDFSARSEREIITEPIVLRSFDAQWSIPRRKFRGELEGIILYLTLPLETGDTMTREIIWPKNLEYRWTDQTYNVQRPIPVD